MADVVVSGDGTVRVSGAAEPGSDFTRAVLDVAGATLSWPDVTALGVPDAEIHDVSRAQQWLWAVYGENVATAVHTADGARVVAEETELARVAARLALGYWAARWWPASQLDGIPALAPELLGLELAALTHQCQQLFDDVLDQPDDLVAELIEEHEAAIEPLVQWWRAARLEPVERVLRLVDAAADVVGLDSEPLRRLRSALDDPGTSADLGSLFAPQSDFALAAGDSGATGRVMARGTAVNDWRRYPPGFVDAAEDAVTWIARATGARRRIEVNAVAGHLSPAVPLAADVRIGDGPANRVPLAKHDDLWTGQAEIAVTANSRIDVGVLLPGFDPGPGEDTRAERDTIRDFARERLAAADPFLAEIVAASGD